MTRRTKRLRAVQRELRRSVEELDEIRDQLGEAYAHFNSISDPDLLDACIYQINALCSKYDYALRYAKGIEI